MLPEPEHRITQVFESLGRFDVSALVSPDLREPELCAGLRLNEMFGAAVPETAINEDEQTRTCEGDVGATPTIEGQRLADPESQSTGMQNRSKSELRLGVSTAICLHIASDSRRHWR